MDEALSQGGLPLHKIRPGPCRQSLAIVWLRTIENLKKWWYVVTNPRPLFGPLNRSKVVARSQFQGPFSGHKIGAIKVEVWMRFSLTQGCKQVDGKNN
jgi:hypothetical protein